MVATAVPVNTTTLQDMSRSRAWTEGLLSSPQSLPIRFAYDGREIQGIPTAWNPTTHTHRIDANIVATTFKGGDSATGLQVRVECLRYLDYPVVEWTAWLSNAGSQPTPFIENIHGLEASFEGASPVLTHCNGDFYSEEGYTPQDTPLPPGAAFACAPTGGRSCDGAFPYFRLQFAGGGLTLAVGWPGQWAASFTGTAQGVGISAGQEQTHLRLLPGESIRTPRITLLAWTGDTSRGVNLWRRWYRAHVLPRPNGQPLKPTLSAAATDEGEEFTAATEDNQKAYMDRWKQAGFDYDVWWIDAGWYPCYDDKHQRRWQITGTWEADPERFPRGLGPVGANVAKNGGAFLLWFEPERVIQGSWLETHHPEWLLRIKDTNDWPSRNALLNLGNPQARQWLTDHYCTLIADYGITVYRQDFNFPPLRHWRENEEEDRQGLTENLHVQGYLQFWDDLLARNPGLWIDSCSSGGRRNDLETLRRSVPLHYTDYGYGIHRVKLAFHHTLFSWIPYFRETSLSWDLGKPEDTTGAGKPNDSFAFHCGMAAMMTPAIDIRSDDNDTALALRMVAIWRRAVDLLLNGDYFPLTPFSKEADRWVIWQFDMPEKGEGLLQGIRLAACPQENITVTPHALRPDAHYILDNQETGETREMSGAALLADGFTFALPPRSGAIWFYHEQ